MQERPVSTILQTLPFPDSLAGQSGTLFGPGEPQMCHKPNEYVEISKYLRQLESWKNFAGTLLNNKLMI